MAFCRDIPSHEKNPYPGDKKSPRYPEGEKSQKSPESQEFCINPGDKNPETKKIPNSGNKNPETQKNPESREFSENPEKILGIGIRDAGSQKNSGDRDSGCGNPKKSHPEANSDIFEPFRIEF